MTPTLLSSFICRADCRCRDGVASPAPAPPQGWPCAAPGPTRPGSRDPPVTEHPGEVPRAPTPHPVRPHCFILCLLRPAAGVHVTSTASTFKPLKFKHLSPQVSTSQGQRVLHPGSPSHGVHHLAGFKMGWLRPSPLAPSCTVDPPHDGERFLPAQPAPLGHLAEGPEPDLDRLRRGGPCSPRKSQAQPLIPGRHSAPRTRVLVRRLRAPGQFVKPPSFSENSFFWCKIPFQEISSPSGIKNTFDWRQMICVYALS